MTLPDEVDAVVFDCDGLLVDTETCWTRAETALFAEHGHPFGPTQKQLVIGQTLESAGVAMAEYLGTPGAGPVLAHSRTGVASARAAGLFVIGVPSLPGVELEVDALFAALTDPSLTAWLSSLDGPGRTRTAGAA